MADYDFKSLSPWEFEQLSRDLLKASLGLDFEMFKSGRDQGIDLRYSSSKDNTVIVQCKHYANSAYSNLKSDLKNNELEKISKLSPNRYILVTSLGLTPNNKTEIANILDGYLLSFSDIVTKDTLNGWLNDHPNIERSHIKLWATSGAVLERIVHSGIFNYTIAQTDLLEEKLCYYVKNKSFDEALAILKEQSFCIIAGMPGIGKTTLAEMLLIDYMNRDYEPIRISSDIDEAFKTYNPNKKQAFYYDDFLGQTGLENKLNKNEDQRIVDFCRICSKSARTVFILTTREYILNQAKETYEKLAKSGLDINKCVLDISSYALLDRAKILYNHLYFRNIPKEYLYEITKDNNYLNIIRHQSFNPRVIEWMTDSLSLSSVPANKYAMEFIDRLDHPAMIWEHAYQHQICESTKHLLLIVLSLPSVVFLPDCKDTFEHFRKTYCSIYGESRTHNEFNTALKESEGNFLRVDLAAGRQTIQFHNPSIRDYLTYYLSKEIELLKLLLKSCMNFDQLVTLWNSFESLMDNPLVLDQQTLMTFQDQLGHTIGTKSLRVMRFTTLSGTSSYSYVTTSIHNQCRFILTCEMDLISHTLESKVKENLTKIFSNLSAVYDWSDITPLLRAIRDSKTKFSLDIDNYLDITLDVLPNSLNQVSDYRQLAEICNDHQIAFRRLSSRLNEFADNLVEGLDDELSYIRTVDDIGTLEECAVDIRRVEEVFNIDMWNELSKIHGIISELEENSNEDIDQPVVNTKPMKDADDSRIIVSMFETLN